jgi:hypothetical protein
VRPFRLRIGQHGCGQAPTRRIEFKHRSEEAADLLEMIEASSKLLKPMKAELRNKVRVRRGNLF